MTKKIFTVCLFCVALMFGAVGVFAQDTFPDASLPAGRRQNNEDDKPKSFKENLAKRQIEQEKKEFQELIKRSEEAAQLSEELLNSFEQTNTLSAEDEKKLQRLGKVVKKIRDELGAEDDEENSPQNISIEKEESSSLINTLKSVKENAANLLSALKKTSRLTISVVAVESSNTLIKLLKFIRVKGN